MLACAISIERESASILAGIFIFSFVLFVLHWASDWCNFSGSFHYQLLLLLQWERKRVLAHSLSLANCRELGNGIRIVLVKPFIDTAILSLNSKWTSFSINVNRKREIGICLCRLGLLTVSDFHFFSSQFSKGKLLNFLE